MTTVYKYYAEKGILLYVGITDRGTQRAREHADKRWWQLARACQLEHYETRAIAEARERELIRIYHPPFNVQHNNLAGWWPDPNVIVTAQGQRAWRDLPKLLRQLLPCSICGGSRTGPWISGPLCGSCHSTYYSQPRTIKAAAINDRDELLRKRVFLVDEIRLLQDRLNRMDLGHRLGKAGRGREGRINDLRKAVIKIDAAIENITTSRELDPISAGPA